jgi:HTH-like domain
VRPAASLICQFITEHRDRFGVAPICRALSAHGVKIAPRTYYGYLSRPPSKRALGDTAVTEILASIYEPDEHGRRPAESLYGSLKMWAHLQRQGIPVAKCTVERLMRIHGWRGVTRGKKIRTTVKDPSNARAPRIWSTGTSTPTILTNSGSRTSLTCRCSAGSATPRSSSTRSPGSPLAGPARCPNTPRSCSGRCAELPPNAAATASSLARCTTLMPVPKADSSGRRNTSTVEVADGTTTGLGGDADG